MATYFRSNEPLPLPTEEWNKTTQWVGATPNPAGTSLSIQNTDGTLTVFVGTGFLIDGSGNATAGTVTAIEHYVDTGTTLDLLEAANGLNLPLTDAQTQSTAKTLISTAFSGSETFTGGTENDILFGYDGADVLNGGTGIRNAFGASGDILIGGAGNDTFNTSSGGDTTIVYDIEGGAGGVTGTVSNAGGTITDTFGNTDTVVGFAFYTLSTGADTFNTGTADDFVQPGAGTDTVNLGAGFDELSYAFSATSERSGGFGDTPVATGITVNFSGSQGSGTVIDPTGATDTFTGVEAVRGTQSADVFNGSTFNDTFSGQGGNDTFNGGGGFDTVRYNREIRSGGLTGVTVNLNTGTATDTFGNSDTLSSIEGIYGTAFGDVLTGNGFDNNFRVFEGNDTIDGGPGGFDQIFYLNGLGAGGNPTGATGITVTMGPTEGAGQVTSTIFGTDTFTNIDRIWGTQLDDTFNGGAFDDWFVPSLGTDTINGGDGFDRIHYSDFRTSGVAGANGITVNMTGQGSGTILEASGTTDTFTGLERIVGSLKIDTFNGGTGDDTFDGARGNDIINGGGGNNDTVRYDFNDGISRGAVVNLTTGTATDGYNNTDTLTGIEHVTGTSFTGLSDQLTGDGNANILRGLAGADTLDGQGGVDTAEYGDRDFGSTLAVLVNLTAGTAVDAFGQTDTLISIENVNGTDETTNGFGDVLVGNTVANTIFARGAVDYVDGAGGDDTIYGGSGGDALVGGLGSDTVVGDSDNDVMLLDDYANVAAGGGNDLAYGGTGNDLLWGYAGNDTLVGGDGDDALVGNDFSETIAVTGFDVMYGGAGNDSFFVGIGGNAFMVGDAGNDSAFGSAGNDTFEGGTGSDYGYGAGGADTFVLRAADLAAGDVDIIYFFSRAEGDLLALESSLNGQISLTNTTLDIAGIGPVASVYATHVSGWSAVIYGTSVADVQASTVFI